MRKSNTIRIITCITGPTMVLWPAIASRLEACQLVGLSDFGHVRQTTGSWYPHNSYERLLRVRRSDSNVCVVCVVMGVCFPHVTPRSLIYSSFCRKSWSRESSLREMDRISRETVERPRLQSAHVGHDLQHL